MTKFMFFLFLGSIWLACKFDQHGKFQHTVYSACTIIVMLKLIFHIIISTFDQLSRSVNTVLFIDDTKLCWT